MYARTGPKAVYLMDYHAAGGATRVFGNKSGTIAAAFAHREEGSDCGAALSVTDE